MSTTTTPPPPRRSTTSGWRSSTIRAARPRCAPGAATTPFPSASSSASTNSASNPGPVAKFSGIGCSSKSPAYFLGLSHGFNGVHGRMPAIATGALLANRTLHGHRRHRRRRHRLHRHRPVHAPGAPQHAADLHHRRQRRLRPHQGPVLGHRRSRLHAQDRYRQRSAALRLLRPGPEMGRHLRRPLLQRRQEAAAGHPEDRHRPPRTVGDRRHLPLRHLQRPRRAPPRATAT